MLNTLKAAQSRVHRLRDKTGLTLVFLLFFHVPHIVQLLFTLFLQCAEALPMYNYCDTVQLLLRDSLCADSRAPCPRALIHKRRAEVRLGRRPPCCLCRRMPLLSASSPSFTTPRRASYPSYSVPSPLPGPWSSSVSNPPSRSYPP